MFKVIDLGPEGKLNASLDANLVCPPPPGGRRWIDVVEHDAEALEILRERFGFHPLAIEDCATFELRSKIDDYGDYLFLVLHTFTEAPNQHREIQVHEVHAFLSKDYLVTVHDNPVPATEQVWLRASTDPSVLQRGSCWALYMVLDTMVDATFPIVEHLTNELEAVEERVLEARDDGDPMEIFHVKRTLVAMRRVLRPLRDAIAILQRRGDDRFDERTLIHLRDVYDHVLRCAETVEEAREVADNVMAAHQSNVSNRTNDVMKQLTIFSAIFLPLGFITGFWGQNFADLPLDHPAVMWGTLAFMVALPVALFFWFSRKKWL